jgi:hypothetical protein
MAWMHKRRLEFITLRNSSANALETTISPGWSIFSRHRETQSQPLFIIHSLSLGIPVDLDLVTSIWRLCD